MNNRVEVFVEIEKNSNIKFEMNKETGLLEIDRILPDPFHYPFCYGFIPNTLAMDGDEVDALILTNTFLANNSTYHAHVVGVLLMEDEKGYDEKILCVLEEDADEIQSIDDLPRRSLELIEDFFINYKKSTPGKWSKVNGFGNRVMAMDFVKKAYTKYFFSTTV
jgi:inorganic pyrophosphatase